MIKIKTNVLLVLMSLFTFTPLTSASTFNSDMLDTFWENASACVIGTVTDINYENRKGLVFTRATFAVSKTAFGSTETEISVLIPGGIVPNTKFPIAQTVAGAPRLNVGQNLMLILNKDANSDDYMIAGFARGAISIINNEAGQQIAIGDASSLMPLDAAIEAIQAMVNGSDNIDINE